MTEAADFFVAGGTLRPDDPSYVTRPEDHDLLQQLQAGEFCYVLTPRQMGKSSLMVRTAQRLRANGTRVAVVDLARIGGSSSEVTADQWYLGVLTSVRTQLRLATDAQTWWDEHTALGIAQRFITFLHDVLLAECSESVAIMIDEIDLTLNLGFRDDFFAAIRAIYNERATDPIYQRLTFALFGVATPTDLIQDRERTPFNIGRRIDLREFTLDDAQLLRDGLVASFPEQSDTILQRIFYWTSGHPYLTQKLCQTLQAEEVPSAETDIADDVDAIVQRTFFSEEGRKDPNLTFVQDRIANSPDSEKRRMLQLYRRVQGGDKVVDDDRSSVQNRLELYGLVGVVQGQLQVRNRIYERVFDGAWIRSMMPVDRRQRRAVLAGMGALVLAMGVAIWLFLQPAPECSVFREQFSQNEDSSVRLSALASLFDQGERCRSVALDLFYILQPEEHEALFLRLSDYPNERERLVTVIDGIYRTLDTVREHDFKLMETWLIVLQNAGLRPDDELVASIHGWKWGRQAFQENRFQTAVSAYRAAIFAIKDESHPVLYYDLALALIQTGEYSDALTELDNIVRMAHIVASTSTPTSSPTSTPSSTSTPSPISSPTPSFTPILLSTPSPIPPPSFPLISTPTMPVEGITPTTNDTSALTREASRTAIQTVAIDSPYEGGNLETPTPTAFSIVYLRRFHNAESTRRTVRELVQENPILLALLRDNRQKYLALASELNSWIAIEVNAPAMNSALSEFSLLFSSSSLLSSVSTPLEVISAEGDRNVLQSVTAKIAIPSKRITQLLQDTTVLTNTSILSSSIPADTVIERQNGDITTPQSSLKTVRAKSIKAAVLTEAQYLLGEGDRANKTSAHEKWLAAADAFARAGNQLGVADAYLRLADSYQFEAVFSRQKLKLAVEYYLKVITAGADVYEALIQKELAFDQSILKEAQTLYERGQAAYTAGNCGQALPLLDQARQRYRQAKLGSGEVRVLTIKAICQIEAENYLGSLSTLLEGLLIAQSLPMGEPLTERYLEGSARYEQGDFTGALTIYEEVRQVYQERNDQESTAETLLNLGNTYAQLGEYVQATEAYQQALGLFLELQLSDTVVYAYADYNEAATRHNLGNLATIDGRYTEAVAQLEQAIALWQADGESANEVSSMNSLGLAWRGLGDYDKAFGTLKRAWDQQQRLSPDLVIEGDIRNNIGYVYYSQGNFQQALEGFDQTLQTRHQLPEPQRSQKLLETNNNIAAVYVALSRFEEALTIYQQLLAQLPPGTPANLAAPLQANMAAIYIAQGDYQRGIATYVDILPALADHKMEPAHAAALQNLGAAYLRTGKLAEGERYLVQAQTIFSTTGDLAAVAAIDNNLGLAYAQIEYYVEATNYFIKALTVWQAQNNQSATAKTLANLALVAAAVDDLPAAIAYGEEALTLSEQSPVPADQARITLILGILSLKGEAYNEAVTFGKQAVAFSAQIADPVADLGGYLILAAAHYLTDDLVAADEAIRVAIDRLENLQGSLTVADLKIAFLDQIGGVYDLALLIALANQQPDQAFLYAEQARARAFLDQLANVHVDFRQGAAAVPLQQEQTLRQKMLDLQSKLSAEKLKPENQQRPEFIASWQTELETVHREHTQLLVELQVSNSTYTDPISANVLSLSDIQQQIVDEQTTLIIYFLPDVAFIDKTLVWVIDQKSVELVALEASAVAIDAQARFLRALLAERASDVEVATTTLYQTLFAPLVPYIHHTNLVIAPHGVLHYLPFAALQDAESGRYLLEDYTITYTPSASALQYIQDRNNQNQGRMLALGNPDGSLFFAETEVEQVAALYASEPLLGKTATESNFITQAPQADIIHLAAHGVYDSFNPLYTRIELAPDTTNDGYLEVHEIFGLDLSNANLVVLSAPETALGQQSRGDEFVGLTRAFFQAGAPTVMTTLWNVDDAATGALMVEFYAQLQAGETPTAALRTAQLVVLAEEQWQSPYYWAAFTLSGDYRGGE